MSEDRKSVEALSPGAQRLVEAAGEKLRETRGAQLGVHHWLLALLERHGPMAEGMTRGVDLRVLPKYLQEQLQRGLIGAPLDVEALTRQAAEHAQGRGKTQATERDLAAMILAAAGYEVTETALSPVSQGSAVPAAATAPNPVGSFQPRTKRPTPMLEQFGRDLTREAQEGKLTPLVGRDLELQLMIETLCRRTKRNPILVGPAGVGKTAIVEGLAQRMVRGEVPEALRSVRILAIQPSTLVAGASMAGEFEKRMKAVIAEASQEGIVLFVDEAHALIGSGGMAGTGDAASLLKPVLARGELSCIAATTDGEYRRFIEPDEALERRFQPIRVQELTSEQTLHVLRSLRDGYVRQRGIQVADPVLCWLVDFGQQFMRNRYFPDKAVDLLEQCVAYAITQNKTTVAQADAETVAQRLVGMPVALGEQIQVLRSRLGERALLAEDDLSALSNRLEVTLRGLDLRPTRPNAVVLLLGEVANTSDSLAGIIAESLFGAAERVVEIDFSRFTHPEDITMLVGAPPGYVGYSDALPLHRVAQMPWCVVLWKNVHACHPQVRLVLEQALADGLLTDARGKRVYLSDAVVLLTAEITLRTQRSLGFQLTEAVAARSARATADIDRAAEGVLGAGFIAQVDLICSQAPTSDEARRRWLRQHLLSDLAERYRKQGVDLHWDESLLAWFLNQEQDPTAERNWERLVDERLSPLLIRYLPQEGGKEARSLLVRYEGDGIRIESHEKAQGED